MKLFHYERACANWVNIPAKGNREKYWGNMEIMLAEFHLIAVLDDNMDLKTCILWILILFCFEKVSGDTDCISIPNCGTCTREIHCVWCQQEEKCVPGSPIGPDGEHKASCHKWRWIQCFTTGILILYVSIGLVGLILICIIACLCRCCLCPKERRDARQRGHHLDDLVTEALLSEKQVSDTPQTDKRRDEMRAKWGIDP